MKSNLFYTDRYLEVEQRIVGFLNARQDYLSITTVKSPRAVGDAIQDILSENFKDILADEHIKYSTNFARRAMADLTIKSGYSRRAWMIELCDNLLEFYPKEIEKIGKRIEYFKKVRVFWNNHPQG